MLNTKRAEQSGIFSQDPGGVPMVRGARRQGVYFGCRSKPTRRLARQISPKMSPFEGRSRLSTFNQPFYFDWEVTLTVVRTPCGFKRRTNRANP